MDDDDGGNRVKQDDWLRQDVLRVWRSGGGGRARTASIAVGDIYRPNYVAHKSTTNGPLVTLKNGPLIISTRMN